MRGNTGEEKSYIKAPQGMELCIFMFSLFVFFYVRVELSIFYVFFMYRNFKKWTSISSTKFGIAVNLFLDKILNEGIFMFVDGEANVVRATGSEVQIEIEGWTVISWW